MTRFETNPLTESSAKTIFPRTSCRLGDIFKSVAAGVASTAANPHSAIRRAGFGGAVIEDPPFLLASMVVSALSVTLKVDSLVSRWNTDCTMLEPVFPAKRHL